MSTSFDSVNVRCPYYQSNDEFRITCEGLTEDSSIVLRFIRKDDMAFQLDNYCSRGFQFCEIAQVLQMKYTDEEEIDVNIKPITDLLTRKGRQSRKQITEQLKLGDSVMRTQLKMERKLGALIMPAPGGGYKMAETPEDQLVLLRTYSARILDMLETYHALKKSIQSMGQLRLEEFKDLVE